MRAGTARLVTIRAGDQVVCDRCVLADRPLARMRGLLGRRGLARGEGLLIRPTNSVHTFFMRFPIDVVFLDRDETIVKIADNVAPWRMRAARGARSVLELAAGESTRLGLRAGARLQIAEVGSRATAATRGDS